MATYFTTKINKFLNIITHRTTCPIYIEQIFKKSYWHSKLYTSGCFHSQIEVWMVQLTCSSAYWKSLFAAMEKVTTITEGFNISCIVLSSGFLGMDYLQ
jgi:hypothetical protein